MEEPAGPGAENESQPNAPPASDNDTSASSSREGRSKPAKPQPHRATKREVRPSRMDQFVFTSSIAQSQFWGFYNLACVGATFYLLGQPVARWHEKNEFFEPTLAKAMFEDFFLLMFMWAQFVAISFSAFYIHKAFRKGRISTITVHVLQHSIQAVTIAYAVGACLRNNWAIIPSTFVLMLSTIYFMKMHSFTESNLEFFEAEKKGLIDRDPGYPSNLTLTNFAHYMICPVLVYETSYPRSDHKFRWGYFIHKVFSLVTAIALLYVVATTAIIPVAEQSLKIPIVILIAKLAIPMLVSDLLMFFILFECICNGVAELAGYGDREFYEDWWNSTTMDEYSRRWNRPVHEFLMRHVYLESMNRYRLSKRDASAAVFVFSALLHELILSVAFRTVRFYLFAMMMLQIPLIQFTRRFKTAGWKFGNVMFWFGISVGVPLLTACYAREWASQLGDSPRRLVLV